jgi:hypothetical protein
MCKGERSLLAHVNYGFNPKTGGCDGEEKAVVCLTCDGVGTITSEHAQRIEDGKRMRMARVERGETLMAAATRMGLRPSELSAIESGQQLAQH